VKHRFIFKYPVGLALSNYSLQLLVVTQRQCNLKYFGNLCGRGDGENYTLRSFVIVLLIKCDKIGGDCSIVGMWEICGNFSGRKRTLGETTHRSENEVKML